MLHWREMGTGAAKINASIKFIVFMVGEIRGYGLTAWDVAPQSCRNQSIDLLCKSMDWFLYDMHFYHEYSASIFNSLLFDFYVLF